VCGNCEDQNRFVRLEKVNTDFVPDVAPPFSHPLKLAPNEWTGILSSIYVQKLKPGILLWGGKENKEPAFNEEEIQYLSTTLPQAFEKAQPDEIVVYALSRSPLPDMAEISTGGLFVTQDALHVILSNHHHAVSLPGIRELLWEHPLHSQGTQYVFAQGNHHTIRKQDLLGITPKPLALTITYKALLLDLTNSSEPASGLSPTISPVQDQPLQLSVEDSLDMLKRLRERDLITEEEFQQKKQELLNRF
jgi:hypothetical protein